MINPFLFRPTQRLPSHLQKVTWYYRRDASQGDRSAMLRPNLASTIAAALSSRVVFTGLCMATAVLIWPSDRLADLFPPQSPRHTLAEILGRARFSEGRLTGENRYSPPLSADLRIEPTRELLAASRRISEGVERDASPTSLADAAFLQLANGWENEAITSLQRALSQESDDPKLWSDLAAAYLQRGLRHQKPVDLVEALESAARAVQLKPSLIEARFNLAIALERLHLSSEAIVAWREFLILDSWSGWADEAREHLRLLEADHLSPRKSLEIGVQRGNYNTISSIARRFPQAARVYAQDILLPRWGAHYVRHEFTEAALALASAHVIGNALGHMGGDRTILDAVVAVEKRRNSKGAISLLAQGYELYGLGADYYEHDRLSEAAGAFSEAADLLNGEAIGYWAEFWSAVLAFYDGRREYALGAIARLGERPELATYSALRGRVLWAKGLMYLIRSDLAISLPLYQSSLMEFQRLGEEENLGTVEWLVSENFRFLGELDTAWEHRWKALEILSRTPDSPWRHNLLLTSTQVLLQERRLLAALYFQNEEMASAKRWNNSLTLAQAHLVRARIHRGLNSFDQARADLRAAIEYINKIPRGGLRDRVQADVAVAEAEILTIEGARIMRPLLAAARSYYEETGRRSQAASAYLLQARSNLIEGDLEAAEGDLLAAIALQEKTGDGLRGASQVHSFREQWQLLFDDLLRIQVVHQERADLAFASAERSKRGNLATRSSVHSLSLEQAQAMLPADHALIEYALLPDRLLVWAIWSEGWIFVQTQLRSEDLEALVDSVVLEVRHGNRINYQSASRKAFRLLLRPAIDRIPANARLVIIPDKTLSKLPYGALVDDRSGKILLEQRIISVAPSASSFLDSVKFSRHEQRDWRLLAIGNPSIDPTLFPDLKPLPGAEAEVAEIARLYRKSRVITGKDATLNVLLRELPQANLLHFAGHSLQDPRRPEQSLLVLASHPDDSELPMFSSREIQALDLGHLRLVVLSACATAPGSRYRSNGVSGAAQAFLDGGVRAVLASLWKVDDVISRKVLTEFHRRINRGEDGASALRAAQLEVITEKRGASVDWAAFQLAGFVPPTPEED